MAYSIGGADGAGKKKSSYMEDYMRQQQAENMLASQSASRPNYSGGTTTKTGGTTGGTIPTVDNTPAFDWGAYYAELSAQAQARANAAYERNMGRIADAYGSAAGSLRSNYDSTVERLNAARDKSMSDVNTDAEKSLQEAYLNNMLTKKNLNQRLSAMGYNGGASESTMAQLANNYGNSRTGINETLNKNINDLNMTYGDNLAAALQSYNSAMANLDLQKMQLEMQAENARQNAEASSMSAGFGIDSSYLSALQAALTNQANYQYDPSVATNDFVAGNVQQAQSTADANNYAKKLAQLMLEASQNNVIKGDYAAQLAGYDPNTLASFISQLRQRGYSVQ